MFIIQLLVCFVHVFLRLDLLRWTPHRPRGNLFPSPSEEPADDNCPSPAMEQKKVPPEMDSAGDCLPRAAASELHWHASSPPYANGTGADASAGPVGAQLLG